MFVRDKQFSYSNVNYYKKLDGNPFDYNQTTNANGISSNNYYKLIDNVFSKNQSNPTKSFSSKDFWSSYEKLLKGGYISKDSQGAWGDPHYTLVGNKGNSINFDHKGKDYHKYNVFEGDDVSITGTYVPWTAESPQVIGAVDAKAGKDNVHFDTSGKITVNGTELAKGEYKLNDGTTLKVDPVNKKIILVNKDGNSQVSINAANGYIDIDPEGYFTNMGGIIGKSVLESRALTNDEADKFEVMG